MAAKAMQHDLPPALQTLAPYHHDIEIADGVFTNPQTFRIRNFRNLVFPHLLTNGGSLAGKRILDLGCNCGGIAFTAWKLGAQEVVGLDCRAEHIAQANAIKGVLGASSVTFHRADIADIPQLGLEPFDIVVAAGILYHLPDPIGAFRTIASICRDTFVVESHVHYSADTRQEDMPSWWMLSDTDMGDCDGLYHDHPLLNRENYDQFEASTPVDYSVLPGQHELSPQGERDLQFAARHNPLTLDGPTPHTIAAKQVGELVMVPNRKALIRLLRYNGFVDIVDVVPHRFSEPRWLKRYRIALVARSRTSLPASFNRPLLPPKTADLGGQ